jgi:hypothetical protein
VILNISHKEQASISGVVIGTEVRCADPEFEALGPVGWGKLLRERNKWHDLPEYLVQAAIRKGALAELSIGRRFISRHVDMVPVFGQGQNRIVKRFFDDLFARMGGTPDANQTLAVEYFAAGANYATATDPTDTQLVKEVFRKIPSQIYNNNLYQITISTHLLSTDWNLTALSVTAATIPTTTQFTVNDASELSVGDAIEVVTPLGSEDCTVTAIATNLLTVYALNTANHELPQAPVTGAAVYRKLAEWGSFMGGAATSSPNTGALMNRKLELYTKTNSAGVLVDNIFSFQPSGT